MATTSARLLTLLGLLQSRPDWSGAELAERLDVTDRTVRNDVARLRDLGYPVDAVRGPGGRYRLGAGARVPPLLLDDAEAVAVAVGLRRTTATAGFEDPARSALAKLEQVMPDRLRRRLASIRDASASGPENTDSNVEDPAVDTVVLAALADAVRDHQACAPTTATSPSRSSRTASSRGSAAGSSSPARRRPGPGRRTASTGSACARPAADASRPRRSPAT